ncbi:MAG: hypothetical protein U0V73_06365 [Acidimicrobiia bacterium]
MPDPARDRATLVAAFRAARASGDVEGMCRAALALPSSQRFGTDPGQVPALLHEAYVTATDDTMRARLAAGIARAWVYGGDADRARAFAVAAEAHAREVADGAVLADALDAALTASWGPDDFATRVTLAARLSDTAAHLTDPEPRLAALLWRLTTAWECLDAVAVQRRLRALDVLAEETGSTRVQFFALSRRAMHAFTTGDVVTGDALLARTVTVARDAGEPDARAVVHSLTADRARCVGDRATLRAEAESFEEYGAAEGVISVLAESSGLWLLAGDAAHAANLLGQVAGDDFGRVPRDVDFLLTLTSCVRVAAATRAHAVAAAGASLLEPFAGRAVLNAGAVTFHGVVDDALARAHAALGHAEAARYRHAADTGYRRIGATWWAADLAASFDRSLDGSFDTAASPLRPAAAPAPARVHLHRASGGLWSVGEDGQAQTLPDLKGLHYLAHLVARPGRTVAALDLSDSVAGHPGTGVHPSDAGARLDDAAIAAYRHRLGALDTELAEAEDWNDPARAERLRAERDALVDEITAAVGLGGRARVAGSTVERARVAVRKAITAAVDRIERHDPALARLLRTTVRTGVGCSYEPDPDRPLEWLLDP